MLLKLAIEFEATQVGRASKRYSELLMSSPWPTSRKWGLRQTPPSAHPETDVFRRIFNQYSTTGLQ